VTDLIAALDAPVADPGTGQVTIGMPVSRVDGRAKVTGRARYAAEYPAADLVFGVVVNSTIAKGRIIGIDTSAARAIPGVLDILTHEHRPPIRALDLAHKDMTAPAGSPFKALLDGEIYYSGQPVALVVAQTFETARHAARLVAVEYAVEPHETNLMANLERAHEPTKLKVGFVPPPDEKGATAAAFAAAPVKIEAEFYSGVEHHNPMEMFATTVIRADDGHLTIYDKTQSSQNARWFVSRAFGLSKDEITVRNPMWAALSGPGCGRSIS